MHQPRLKWIALKKSTSVSSTNGQEKMTRKNARNNVKRREEKVSPSVILKDQGSVKRWLRNELKRNR